ncbi:MAG: TauD/TfdA family dioxygenase [Rhodospirillaceae bacterium]|nr:TauD/TfdA family dioxygenase [Rhodospirillaceae bacterium]MBT5194518.1 TauD/TfdA family dioxygenase [Rhodospirillaceae bacterium]MBT5899250.1 TauD/TfdA family dioxygenase [Rhodospirillaceae bacterium]MBT6427856.1 TauD/TfdA family dioxygenase [Rhodospirillaceae bacterium]MBT7665331.1 TauD/TfdA family dioxygenase [Rhodospirillaceae bacterium]
MISVNPLRDTLSDTFGAEVVGLDLRRPMKAETVATLNQALLDNIILVIRGQDLTAREFRDGIANFGAPMMQHRAHFRLPECPEVSRIVNRENMRPAAMWHTDHTNHERPPKATVLYARKLPGAGGDTCFADMYEGLRYLSSEARDRIENMVTLNSMEPDSPSYSAADRARHSQGVRHPMVRTHPETGKQALYFHLTKALDIEGMENHAVRPFLDDLLDQAIRPENTLRHHWTLGDVVICDNRCAMHRADPDFDQAEERLLWRVILEGDKPV